MKPITKAMQSRPRHRCRHEGRKRGGSAPLSIWSKIGAAAKSGFAVANWVDAVAKPGLAAANQDADANPPVAVAKSQVAVANFTLAVAKTLLAVANPIQAPGSTTPYATLSLKGAYQ